MNIADLPELFASVKSVLKNGFGYELVSNPELQCDRFDGTLTFYVYVREEFKDVGEGLYLPLDPFGVVNYSRVQPRWERELRHLSQTAGNLIEANFRTEFAQRFVQDLAKKREEIAGLLTEDRSC